MDNMQLVKNLVLDMLNIMEARQCSHCKKYMMDGYCIEGGDEYYCNDECLESNMTREEFDALYNEGEGDSYWTEWDENINEYHAVKVILSRFPEITDIKLQ